MIGAYSMKHITNVYQLTSSSGFFSVLFSPVCIFLSLFLPLFIFLFFFFENIFYFVRSRILPDVIHFHSAFIFIPFFEVFTGDLEPEESFVFRFINVIFFHAVAPSILFYRRYEMNNDRIKVPANVTKGSFVANDATN